MPQQPDKNTERQTPRRTRTPAQERGRYLRRLYFLLSLIVVLLFVMILLVPEGGRNSVGDGQSPYVGGPEPAWSEEDHSAPSDEGEASPSGQEQSDRESGAVTEAPRDPDEGQPDPETGTRDPEATPREPTETPDERESSGGREPGDSDDGEPGAAQPAPDDGERGRPDEETSETEQDPDQGAAYTGSLYFVLDDVGYNISELEPFLDLEIPMTIAVLPHLDFSREAASLSRQADLDVILHLPMEPAVEIDPGPGAILTEQSSSEMRRRVGNAIESVPGVIGANNHMGSEATADARVMRTVIDELASKDLFFLDSRTSADSQVEVVSGTLELPYIRRHLFVDHDRDKDAMRQALSRGIERASEYGAAIVIGHVQTPGLPLIIEEAAQEARRRGVRFDGLSHYRDRVFLAHRSGEEVENGGGR